MDGIQVHTGEIAAPRECALLQHLNDGLRARRTLNGTPELAYGVTPVHEVGLHLPFTARGR